MPPGLRQEILAAKPPPVAGAPFEDTVPPNVVIGERRNGDDERVDAPSDEVRVHVGRNDPAHRVKQPSGTRPFTSLVGVGAAILAFAVIVILAVQGTLTQSGAPATLPAVEVPAAEAPTSSVSSLRAPSSGKEHGGTGTAIAPPPTAVAPEHAPEARRPAAATRDDEPKVVGPTAHQVRALPSVTPAQPRPHASARAGAFATPLAPPDK